MCKYINSTEKEWGVALLAFDTTSTCLQRWLTKFLPSHYAAYTADTAFSASQISFMIAAKCRFPSKYNMDSETR